MSEPTNRKEGNRRANQTEIAKLALRALRASGKFVEQRATIVTWEPGFEFATLVTDPTRVKMIQTLADFIYEAEHRKVELVRDHLLASLRAINDTERLNKIGEDAFVRAIQPGTQLVDTTVPFSYPPKMEKDLNFFIRQFPATT